MLACRPEAMLVLWDIGVEWRNFFSLFHQEGGPGHLYSPCPQGAGHRLSFIGGGLGGPCGARRLVSWWLLLVLWLQASEPHHPPPFLGPQQARSDLVRSGGLLSLRNCLWAPHSKSTSTSYWSVSPAPHLTPSSSSSRAPALPAPAPSWSKRLTGSPNVGKLSHSLNAHIPFSLLRLVSHLIFNLPCVHLPVKKIQVTIIKNKTSSNN